MGGGARYFGPGAGGDLVDHLRFKAEGQGGAAGSGEKYSFLRASGFLGWLTSVGMGEPMMASERGCPSTLRPAFGGLRVEALRVFEELRLSPHGRAGAVGRSGLFPKRLSNGK